MVRFHQVLETLNCYHYCNYFVKRIDLSNLLIIKFRNLENNDLEGGKDLFQTLGRLNRLRELFLFV